MYGPAIVPVLKHAPGTSQAGQLTSIAFLVPALHSYNRYKWRPRVDFSLLELRLASLQEHICTFTFILTAS